MTEDEWIEQLKNGHAAAFKLFVEDYSTRVYNTALSILQNQADAEDTAQEVFIEVYRSVKGFKGQSKLSTWVYRITVTKCYELLRKKNTQKRLGVVLSLFAPDDTSLMHNPPDFVHPGISLENKENAAILFKAIDALPPKQRTAFVLHKIEGLSYAEIAEVMHVTLSSVESLIFRARQNLQNWLSDFYDKK